MSSWSGIDFFIFLVLVMNILLGMSRGGLRETISMISLFVALIITIKFTITLTNWMNSSPLISDVLSSKIVQNFMISLDMPPLTSEMLYHLEYCLSLLICFVGAYSFCEAVLAYTNAVEAFGFSVTMINRKLGAALGTLRGCVLIMLFIVMMNHLFEGKIPASVFMHALAKPAQTLDTLINNRAPERYKEILQDKNLYNPEPILNQLMNPK